MDSNTISLLKDIELLDSLSDEELREISAAFVIKKVNKSELVLDEEDTNNVMYMVLSGELKIVQTSTGAIVEINQPNLPIKTSKSGRMSWRSE